MIRLIASDIDGTLMPYGERALPTRLFPLIHRLRAEGILFCPASGRQYHSLRTLFAPVADEVCFLCENGAALFGPGTEETAPLLSKTVVPREDALALSRAILAQEGCDLLISGQNVSYVCDCGDDFVRRMTDKHGNLVRRVDAPEDIQEDIIKVSAYCPNGLDAPAAALGPRWGEPLHMAVAGPAWLDFTLADKGTGLRGLCAALDIPLGETMAFGDNWNDLPMLRIAGQARLMERADPALRREIPQLCANVCDELERLLEQR
jgi:HAD superfamily hydrolase (TIGR01484 family)